MSVALAAMLLTPIDSVAGEGGANVAMAPQLSVTVTPAFRSKFATPPLPRSASISESGGQTMLGAVLSVTVTLNAQVPVLQRNDKWMKKRKLL